MRIIDTSTINHILENGVDLREVYYLTPDVKDEAEIAELVAGKKLPNTVKEILNLRTFDEAAYIKNYKDMLNKYRGRSFYNMTGFGDISILAALKTAKDIIRSQPQKLFFYPEDELEVITEDDKLKKKVEVEFNAVEKKEELKIRISGYKDLF